LPSDAGLAAERLKPGFQLLETSMSNAQNSNKGEPEHNKAGNQGVTQKNEPARTPESRNDREAQLGSNNQTNARKGNTSGHQH
jgi:hypothetical protein